MITPKAVVFDLGKVLLDFDYTIAARKLIKSGKLGIVELAKIFTAPADVLLKYEAGGVTTTEFYNEICSVTGYRGDIEEFAACFGDIFTPIQPLINAQAEIKKRGIATYLFSNTNELAMRHVRASYPFINNFDHLILSCEHKVMKPDPAFYEVVERISGQRGPQIVYIDDRAENIATGAKRGWRTILQQDPAKTRAELAALGLLNR